MVDEPDTEPSSPMPEAPPKLDVRRLWISLLTPSVLMALAMLCLLVIPEGRILESIWMLGTLIGVVAGLVCWLVFGFCINQRFTGPSRVLLILGYPLLQLILLFTIFFFGCLAVFSKSGFH